MASRCGGRRSSLDGACVERHERKMPRGGMDDFLVKPFDDCQLAETLRRWLDPVGPAKAKERKAGWGGPAEGSGGPREVVAERIAAEQIIDLRVIDGLRALDRDGHASRLERAASRFQESAPPLAAVMLESRDKGNSEALWKAAHSLKSGAGALGAARLSRRCAEIEACARHSGIEAARPLLESPDRDVTEAVHGLRALIGEMHVRA